MRRSVAVLSITVSYLLTSGRAHSNQFADHAMNRLQTRHHAAAGRSIDPLPHHYSITQALHWFADCRQNCFGVGFKQRYCQDEWMDQPDLDAELHRAALAGLARINWLSGAAPMLGKTVWQFARQRRLFAPRILDVASGAGDLTIKLWQSGRRRGFDPQLIGWDKSPLAIEYARRQAEGVGADVQFRCVDVFASSQANQPIRAPEETFDIVICSLFLHHLDEAQAVELLKRMARLSSHLVLVNDLHRGTVNYLLVALASRLVTRSAVVHVDALRSIRAAFTPREVAQLANCAGLSGARVETRRPCRLLLAWSKPQ
jgi:2-polyprenyl-3-methyl-5-hydroxy-6-metoxy-1,4-benzoquinol methylase